MPSWNEDDTCEKLKDDRQQVNILLLEQQYGPAGFLSYLISCFLTPLLEFFEIVYYSRLIDDVCDNNRFIPDAPSCRSSPELIANPELRDIDQLSFASQKSAPPPTAEEIRRSEELRRAKATTAHRLQLERVLFADVDTPSSTIPLTTLKVKTSLVSATKLKRATAATHVNSEAKTKTRSKKVGKMSSGRNNDRKVSNKYLVF
ncbi:hypothetical protein DICVIV_12760 [Dictyocaulus viviparus]|uniref:Uncharacterized protein n=1 Tax=Dictyocaulus viviparus TaxID=29172 RepID=A0A0D8XC95_DICVI|nr:hypothetical protein DICVIV_12760 [Dictyocaulus viviparus]